MTQQKKIKITNGDMEALVSPNAAKAFERHGWTVADDGSSEVVVQRPQEISQEVPASQAPQQAAPATEAQPETTTSGKAE